MKRDAGTYGRIRRQYDDWAKREATRPRAVRSDYPREPYAPQPEPTSQMSKMVHAAIGIGIGVFLLALSAFSFYVAARWGAQGRDGAQTGYMLVAFFLLVAGIGGIAATYNHNFKVLNRPGPHY